MARGIADLVDTIRVRHISGGTSRIAFKSYEKGREKWQGETLHRVWFDEEPPHDIYDQGLTNMMRGAALAPQLANQDYVDIGQLANAGATQQNLQQQQINDAIQRYNYNQNLPYNNLSNYLGLIQGNYGSSSTQTTQNAVNPLMGALGMANSGFDPYSAIGSMAALALMI